MSNPELKHTVTINPELLTRYVTEGLANDGYRLVGEVKFQIQEGCNSPDPRENSRTKFKDCTAEVAVNGSLTGDRS